LEGGFSLALTFDSKENGENRKMMLTVSHENMELLQEFLMQIEKEFRFNQNIPEPLGDRIFDIIQRLIHPKKYDLLKQLKNEANKFQIVLIIDMSDGTDV
jgi:hypothetical protein